MFKFLKSLFSEHHPDKFPKPETQKPKVIPHGQGTSSGYEIKLPYPELTDEHIQKLYDALTSDYWSETSTKKLPKRDSKGRFSK